jgi:hypothetical protein
VDGADFSYWVVAGGSTEDVTASSNVAADLTGWAGNGVNVRVKVQRSVREHRFRVHHERKYVAYRLFFKRFLCRRLPSLLELAGVVSLDERRPL